MVEFAKHLSASRHHKDHRHMLRKYPSSIRGSRVLTWSVDNGYASNVLEAVELGQRLVDCHLIEVFENHLKGGKLQAHHLFKLNMNKRLYYRFDTKIVDKVPKLSKGDRWKMKQKATVSRPLPISGLHRIVSAHCVYTKEEKKFVLFQDEKMTDYIFEFEVNPADTSYYFQKSNAAEQEESLQASQKKKSDSNPTSKPESASNADGNGDGDDVVQPLSANFLVPAPFLSVPNKGQHARSVSAPVSAEEQPIRAPSKAPERAPPVRSYLYLFCGQRKVYKFCLFTKEDEEAWLAELKGLGLLKKEDSEVEDVIDSNTVLDLQDVLDTPLFREEFLIFLKQSFALENLKFIEAVDAYRQLNDNDERKACALKIYDLYVDQSSAEMVNLDSSSFAQIKDGIAENKFRKNLFDPAYTVVYQMIRRDVYMRFVQTPEYARMIEAKSELLAPVSPSDFPPSPRSPFSGRRTRTLSRSTRAASPHPSSGGEPKKGMGGSIGRRRRSRRGSLSDGSFPHLYDASFAIPTVDDTVKLKSIVKKVLSSDLLKEKRKSLKVVKGVSGDSLIAWLLANEHAAIRPVAEALCQRMMDSGMMWHVDGDSVLVFSPSKSDLYTFTTPAELLSTKSAPEMLKSMDAKPEKYCCGPLLMKGVKYLKVFGILHKNKKKLFVFRSAGSQNPLRIISLKPKTCDIEVSEEKEDTGDTFGSISPSAPAFKVIYFHVGDTFSFRIEDEEDKDRWQEALDDMRR